MDDTTFGACRLEIDGAVCEIDFSDTTDAVGDLVRAATHIAIGEVLASVEFDREPGVWIWELVRFGPLFSASDLLEVSVFDGLTSDAGGKPSLIFRAQCETDAFGRALLAEVDRLTTALDPKTYEAAFQQVVPRRAIEALRAALATTDPARTPVDLESAVTIVLLPDPDASPVDTDVEMERHRQWFRTLGRGIGVDRSRHY